MPGKGPGFAMQTSIMPTRHSSPRVLEPLRRLLPVCRRGGFTAAAAGVFILVGLGPVFGQQAPAVGGQPVVPVNLSADPALLALIAEMGKRSPTFQRQCAVIDRTRGLIVRMRDVRPREKQPYAARTVIRRHEFGATTAEVELFAAPDLTEVVAHEFEHLIEQIEGVNLRLMSLVSGSGVRQTVDGSYETWRAVLAGRQVAHECNGVSPGPVVTAEATY